MLIVGIILLSLMAVMLVVFLWDAEEKFPKEITVSADGVTESILPIRDLHLNPTETKEYNVNLFCRASGGYNVYLDFEETEDGGMKPFVDVAVKVDGFLKLTVGNHHAQIPVANFRQMRPNRSPNQVRHIGFSSVAVSDGADCKNAEAVFVYPHPLLLSTVAP